MTIKVVKESEFEWRFQVDENDVKSLVGNVLDEICNKVKQGGLTQLFGPSIIGKEVKPQEGFSSAKAEGIVVSDLSTKRSPYRKEVREMGERIISFLNEKAKTNYKPSSQTTLRLINARMNDGFVEEEFKQAIIYCVNKWTGHEVMGECIRPQTIFSGKMESYAQGFRSNAR